MKRYKKYGIIAALAVAIAVPVLLTAQSYLFEVQGGGILFRAQDPKMRYPGTLTLETQAGVDTLKIEADGDLVFEGATADAFETTIAITDPTADRTITIPDASGAINLGMAWDVIFCGDLPNNTTNYMSPVAGYAGGAIYADGLTANDLSYALAGTGCAAEDNATEATADEVLYANNAAKILGMYCAVSGSGSNGVTLNLRSAEASLTPDVTVTIPTTETTAATVAVTTTDVAAGATMALRAITTEDLSAQDVWCVAKVYIVP